MEDNLLSKNTFTAKQLAEKLKLDQTTACALIRFFVQVGAAVTMPSVKATDARGRAATVYAPRANLHRLVGMALACLTDES